MYDELTKAAARHGAKLVVVTKKQPLSKVLEVYQNGQRIFAENYVQEILKKRTALPNDVEWHLIGHLQTNKVADVAPFVKMIHAVDSLRLLKEIEKQAQKNGRVIDCLLQFHIAAEETKYGLSEEEAVEILENEAFATFTHLRICGVMGMATQTDDMTAVRREFQHLKGIFERLKTRFFADQPCFKEISMGMSADWQIALEEGSTLLRVGSLVFA